MTLTPSEAAELRRLQRELEQEDAEIAGHTAIERIRTARAAPPAADRPFSIYRFTVGSLRDHVQSLLDTSQDISHSYRTAAAPYVGDTAANVLSGDYFLPAVGRTVAPSLVKQEVHSDQVGIKLPALEGEENAGAPERFARGVGAFALSFIGWSRALGVARGATWLGRAGRGLLAGAATDFTQIDPVSGNMANVTRDVFGIKSDMLDAIASDEDEDAVVSRFKAAAAGAPLGIAGDALMELGARGVRAYKAWKGTADEAAAIVDSMKRDISLDPKARQLPVPVEGEAPKNPFGASNDNAARPAANDNAARAADDAVFEEVPKKPFDKAESVSTKAPPQDFEDVLDYLKRQVGNPELNEGEVGRFAKNLLFGDPENALAKIGIDPAKLDFSKYDDPDMLGRMQRGMAELYENYASQLGRSNLRVTEAATVSAARSFASSAEVLKNLHGSTENLAEELMGARMFIGAHAHKLLALADEAADEIVKGGAGEKWTQFMESFHRHAYYLGAVRGAGSEVGRALRSLQMIAKVSKPKAAKAVGDALENEAAQQIVKRNSIPEGASAFADRLTTDAQKLEALANLKALGGDVGELSRAVRRENFTILKRLNEAAKETMGNLFSLGTATYNLASGMTMLGSRVLTRSMSTAMRLALAVGGGEKAGVAARMAAMDTWAYTHGIVSGFGDAYRNVLLVLEKEGGSELALNLDSMGLSKLAVAAAEKSAKASAALGESTFERADVKNYRNLAILPSERLALQKMAEELPGPAFFQKGLSALARVVAGSVNAVGSLSRAGTMLFINLPDEFVGTLASRAGAYSYAVRTAANEAAELGLEGPNLSTYLKARTVQLTEHTPGWHPDGFNAGVHEAMGAAGEAEAREVLFQDDLEIGISRAIDRGLTSTPLMHLIVPFVKTPLRILERTAIDYTPLGLLKDRVRTAILAGGPAGDEAIARLSLGILAVATAYGLADDRQIIGNDGGYTSAARLSRDSYSLKIGDDAYQFNRLDPLGTLLGMGADVRAYYRSLEGDPEAPGTVQQATEAFVWATTANILSKTWLTSLRNLTDLAGSTTAGSANSLLDRIGQGLVPRFVPASGVQRQLAKVGDQFARQAFDYTDQLHRASLGAGELPQRRDPLLGRPVPLDGLDRLIGLRGGPSASEADDPLQAELERLSFSVPGSQRSIEGVKLTAAQYSRFLELKGQVSVNPKTGLTLDQTLEALIGLPAYRELPDRGRIEAIRDEMKDFTRLASMLLLREDRGLAYKVLRQETYDRLNVLPGFTPKAADAETARLAKELGLAPVD